MAPPLSTQDGGSSTQSIYTFPIASSKSPPPAVPKATEPKNAATTAKPPTIVTPITPRCSPLTSEAARYFLHRRLLLPTLAVPVFLLFIPPLIASFLSIVAYIATSSHVRHNLLSILVVSTAVLSLAILIVHKVTSEIKRHAPDEKKREEALRRSRYALPFWSMVIALMVVRTAHYFMGSALNLILGSGGGETSKGWLTYILGIYSTSWYWSTTTIQSSLLPILAWSVLATTILSRYIGPLSPFMRCSSVPLRINPFDAILSRIGRNCTSKERFLDMIAGGLDRLAAPSSVQNKKPENASTMGQSQASQMVAPKMVQSNSSSLWSASGFSTKARYSRPSVLAIIVQIAIHAGIGHLFGHTIVLPFLEAMGMIDNTLNATATIIILMSCILGSVFELLAAVPEAELQYDRYSLLYPDFCHLWSKMKRLGSIVIVASIISACLFPVWSQVGHLFINGHDVVILSPSLSNFISAMMLSIASTGILVVIMAFQDEITRWTVCAPDIDPDILVHKSVNGGNPNSPFLAEDLCVQSILMGDGATVEKVLGSALDRTKGPQEDEIARNEQACSSFALWIKESSTTQPGKIWDDILRMCLLQSFGGNGSTQTRRILTRLHLSAATCAPGAQPIIVPLARSLIAFAGGLGESITNCFRQERKGAEIIVRAKSAESWVLPSGSLSAGTYAILGAARMVVMNANAEERFKTKHLSLLMPCVLESAFKLRSGTFEYALFEANASGTNLSTPDGNGLLEFITAKHPELHRVISACDDAAKMVINCLRKTGDESVLLRFKGAVKSWIIDLNCQITGA